MYDVPAFIDYVLAVTKRPKLTYIGHSLGTAEFFIAMIQHPRLNAKIHKMIALAPISSKARLESPVRFIFPFLTPPLTVRLWLFTSSLSLSPIPNTNIEINQWNLNGLIMNCCGIGMNATAGSAGEVPETRHLRQQRLPAQGAA